MRRSANLALAVSVLAATNICAAESTTNRLPEVVVTSTRIPTATEETPTTVTVLQGDDLERQQVRTVAEALRAVPGLSISQYGQPGGLTSVFMRGAESDHTLVLIDGIRANNGYDSLFDFSNMPIENIDRIEVLRGPQSGLYGSEAIGGVINIVTKRGAANPTGAITVEGGSFNSIRARANFAVTQGRLSFTAGGNYFESDNHRINSAIRQRDINASVRYQLLDQLDATVAGWFRDSRAGSPGMDSGWGANDPLAYLDDENSNIALTLHANPVEYWDTRLVLSHNHVRRFFSDPNGNQGASSWTQIHRNQVDFQNIFTISTQHKLVAGMTIDNANAYRDGFDWGGFPTHISPTVNSYAGYANYKFTPHPRLTLTAGGRLESFDTGGEELTGRIGARYTVPGTETILRANLGTGFRSPSLLDLFYPGFSNPNLKPERSAGWDLGFEQPLLNHQIRLGTSYFQNEFDDLIQYDPATFTINNIGKARTVGVESFAAFSPIQYLSLRASHTWLPIAEERATGRRLPRRPRHTATLSANYRFFDRLDAAAQLQIAGDRHDIDPVTFNRVKADAHVKLDLSLTWQVCPHFSVLGRVENVSDEEYTEVLGYPALGRTFWGGVTVKF
jgi:vitamin B12 transporter